MVIAAFVVHTGTGLVLRHLTKDLREAPENGKERSALKYIAGHILLLVYFVACKIMKTDVHQRMCLLGLNKNMHNFFMRNTRFMKVHRFLFI